MRGPRPLGDVPVDAPKERSVRPALEIARTLGGTAVPLAAIGATILEAALDILPATGLIDRLTLARLLLVLAVAGLLVAGARLQDFRTGADIAIGLLLVAAIATTVRGGWDGAPLRFLITAVVTYYVVVATIRRLPDARSAIALVALTGVAAAAGIGIAQVAEDAFTGFYRDGLEPITSEIVRPDLQVRAIGSFINPNLLAAFVVLLGPIGLATAAWLPRRELRWAVFGLTAIAYVGLVLTFSRGAILGALLGALVAVLLLPAAAPIRRAAIWTAGILAALLVIAAAATAGRAVGTFGRIEAWDLAVEAAADAWVNGVGLARAGEVMQALGGTDETFAHAHNLWLSWLTEAGPLGFLAITFLTIWLVVEAARGTLRGDAFMAAALAGFVGFVVMSLTDHPANVERIAVTFWILAGVIAASGARSFLAPWMGGPDDEHSERPPPVALAAPGLADPGLATPGLAAAPPPEPSVEPPAAVRVLTPPAPAPPNGQADPGEVPDGDAEADEAADAPAGRDEASQVSDAGVTVDDRVGPPGSPTAQTPLAFADEASSERPDADATVDESPPESQIADGDAEPDPGDTAETGRPPESAPEPDLPPGEVSAGEHAGDHPALGGVRPGPDAPPEAPPPPGDAQGDTGEAPLPQEVEEVERALPAGDEISPPGDRPGGGEAVPLPGGEGGERHEGGHAEPALPGTAYDTADTGEVPRPPEIEPGEPAEAEDPGGPEAEPPEPRPAEVGPRFYDQEAEPGAGGLGPLGTPPEPAGPDDGPASFYDHASDPSGPRAVTPEPPDEDPDWPADRPESHDEAPLEDEALPPEQPPPEAEGAVSGPFADEEERPADDVGEPVTQVDAWRTFESLSEELRSDPSVTSSTMMAAPSLRRDGRYFAALWHDSRLAVKLPRARSRAMIEEGSAEEFAPAGRALDEWVLVSPDDEDEWRQLLEEARDHSGG